MTHPNIAALYADGGCIGRNPSPFGGTWAFTHVNANGVRLLERSGVVTPIMVGLPAITNNLSEMLALVYGLCALPKDWSGTVYSDSQISLGRLFWGWKWTNIPADLIDMAVRAVRHINLTKTTCVLLDGHPTQAQLAAGVGKRGNPVSVHNAWCDAECTRRAREWQARQARVTKERAA